MTGCGLIATLSAYQMANGFPSPYDQPPSPHYPPPPPPPLARPASPGVAVLFKTRWIWKRVLGESDLQKDAATRKAGIKMLCRFSSEHRRETMRCLELIRLWMIDGLQEKRTHFFFFFFESGKGTFVGSVGGGSQRADHFTRVFFFFFFLFCLFA